MQKVVCWPVAAYFVQNIAHFFVFLQKEQKMRNIYYKINGHYCLLENKRR